MRNLILGCFFLSFLFADLPSFAQQPFVRSGQYFPVPGHRQFYKRNDMSDEFNYNGKPNTSKWVTTDAPHTPGWRGRFPGHFDADAVSVDGNYLRINASRKNKWMKDHDNNWKTFTYQGGLVTSKNSFKYGYAETKMRANRTHMSSTFWMITPSCGSHTGWRGRELDVQETVGRVTGGGTGFDRNMNSNTHYFNCSRSWNNERKHTANRRPNYHAFNTYGVYWPHAGKAYFYLNGYYVGSVTPPANFDLNMVVKMAVETYTWNAGNNSNDGMWLPWWQRTTYYDYVRVWGMRNKSNQPDMSDKGGDKESSETTIATVESLPDEKLDAVVYPNPVTGSILNLEIFAPNQEADTEVVIYNMQGAEVFRKTYTAQAFQDFSASIQLDDARIANGIHMVQIRNAEQVITKPISILR